MRRRARNDGDWRRLLLPRGEAGRAGVGLQRLRPRGGGGYDRKAAGTEDAAQNSRDLAARRHGAGRDRSLGGDPQGARQVRSRSRLAACNRLCGGGLRHRSARRLRLGRAGREAAAACGLGEILSAEGRCAGDRRRASAARARRNNEGDRIRRREGVLRRADRCRYRRDRAGCGRISRRRGSRAPQGRRRHADQHELSRPRCRRTAAERPGDDRAHPAEPDGAVRLHQARSERA